MQSEARKYLNRNDAILSFLSERATFLATWTQVDALKTQLQASTQQIEQMAASQSASGGMASQNVVLKKSLVDALTQDLRDVARTASAMAPLDEGMAKNFAMPASKAEQSIVGAARVFATNAAPDATKAKFIAYGLPADFVVDLNADIALYDEMLSGKNTARQNAGASLGQLESAIEQSGHLADALDAMMKNIYHQDPETLAVWKRAKRIEKLRAHRAPS